MMTDNEVLQIIIGFALWQITWELFLGHYFYTNSEKKKMGLRQIGRFTPTSLFRIITMISTYALIFLR